MKTGHHIAAWFCILLLTGCVQGSLDTGATRPGRFVSLGDMDPAIQLDIRYQTSNNFLGRPVQGYRMPKCILTREAATALVRAQGQARAHGYSLKVYDCFRPQRAVADFVAWAKDPGDNGMQHRFYPAVPKAELFTRGYIADKSGHSRGSTVDLTLVPVNSRQPEVTAPAEQYDCRAPAAGRYPDNSIDMGTGYDCFDDLSRTDNPQTSATAGHNRALLKSILENAGFVKYDREWWHYTLKDEPFPDTCFDFPVQ